MSSVYIKLGEGGAVTWKANVDTYAALPTQGNGTGDIRAVLDTNTIYIWDGAAWNSTGGGGGGSPGGASGTIQYNNAGSFAGDSQLKWDNTGKLLNLNGLAIGSLSSIVSLVDNQPVATTAFSYVAATYNFAILEYSVTRNTSKQVGLLLVVNDGTNATLVNPFADLYNDLGIVFSASVSAGNVNIQYTTTNTGFNASLKYSMRSWI